MLADAQGDMGDLIGIGRLLFAQPQRRFDAAMQQAAAGEGLDLVARLEQGVVAAQPVEAVRRPGQPLGEAGKQPVRAFQRQRRGGEAAAAQSDGGDGVARRQAGMKRLGHGAEIGADGRRHRGGDADAVGDLGRILADQPRRGGGGGDGAQHPGAVPAALARQGREAARQCPADLGADDECGDHLARPGAGGFGQRQQAGHQHRRRLADHERQIVIQRLGGGAVGQRRVLGRAAHAAPDDGGHRRGAVLGRHLDHLAGGGLAAAGQHDADGVGEGGLADRDQVRRRGIEVEAADEIRDARA